MTFEGRIDVSAATKLPGDVGAIHFVGIGGIGMSGIAEVLLNHGYTVQGSDLKASRITERLEKLGAKVFVGQKAENLDNAQVVVISSAIKRGNPELDEARTRGLPVVRRAEMLAELMRLKSNVAIAGTHGKTTTTTMVATLLDAGNFDPTVINGGIIHAYGSNARVGLGEWMVVEADESDGTFNRLPATIAIVTNIDPEHMDHWGDFDTLRKGFLDFVSNIPFYGLAVCCTDHPEVQALVGKITDRRVTTYGFNAQADIRAVNLTYKAGVAHFDILLQAEGARIDGCSLPMPGDHNVSNALSAAAPAATWASSRPLAGLRVAKVFPESASTLRPPMTARVGGSMDAARAVGSARSMVIGQFPLVEHGPRRHGRSSGRASPARPPILGRPGGPGAPR